MNVINVRYNWPLSREFSVSHDEGPEEYVLMHFLKPVDITIANAAQHADSGTFVVISPGTPYRLTCKNEATYDWMHVVGEVASNMHVYGLNINKLYSLSNSKGITTIIEEMEFNFYNKPYYWWRFSAIKLEELFMNISHNIGQERYVNENDGILSRLTAIHAEMATYPERNWSVQMIASLLHISISRVYPLYKDLFHISPNIDLIHMRVEKAKRLLVSGCSITQAAEDTGYKNLNHFCRQFKQMTGQTPGEFKRTRKSSRQGC